MVSRSDATYCCVGHDTHVCGILGGSGLASNGIYRGIAPECQFIVGKVLDAQGNGDMENLCKAIYWILDLQKQYHIRILNISIGMENAIAEEKSKRIVQLLKEVWKSGIVVVVSAGNNGPSLMSISSIGEAAEIITVGCHDKDYMGIKGKPCKMYSSRGPGNDAIKKPDLVAPGTDIMSCNRQIHLVRGKYQHAYCRKSGTSMATPIVAGAAALLLQKNPELTNTDVKRILLQTAEDLHLPWNVQGYGFLNIEKAIRQNV